MASTLGELAAKVGGEVYGDAGCQVTTVASLQSARPGQISFLSNPRYKRYLATTAASAVILAREHVADCPVNALVVTNPYAAYARIAALLTPRRPAKRGVHQSAVVSGASRIHESAWIGPHSVVEEGARIGPGVSIGPGCYIGKDASIEEGGRLVGHVTICQGTEIGRNALIHPGVVVGSDGFGIANEDGVWVKVPQLGRVRIGNDVEVGANTTIDRGSLEDTVIEDGVKLDNQIQVAHNVCIGANTAIAGCVGIAGSAKIGSGCTIGGGAGILGHLEIVDDVHITAMSLVTRSITKPGIYSSGTPLQENRAWRRNFARFRQLDEMARGIKQLEKKLDSYNKG